MRLCWLLGYGSPTSQYRNKIRTSRRFQKRKKKKNKSKRDKDRINLADRPLHRVCPEVINIISDRLELKWLEEILSKFKLK